VTESGPESDPLLPRVPEDPENLRRLRREALRRMEEDEFRAAAAVYGGPPPNTDLGKLPQPGQSGPMAATVYGGPTSGGGGSVSRRWTLKRILILLAALLAGLTALFVGTRKISAPVYGGPPIQPNPEPNPDPGPKENQPVYGGPRPPDSDDRDRRRNRPKPPTPREDSPEQGPVIPHDSSNPSSPAAVYGGPPPEPQAPPVKPQ
jgi:hypothetical protein